MDTVSYLTINGETREIADYNMRQDINTIQNDLNGVKTSTVYNTTHATVDARFESDESRIKALRDEVDAAHSSTVNKTDTQTAATYSNLDARFEADETKIKNVTDEIAAAHRTSSDTLDTRFDNIESRATAVEDEITAAHSSTQISGGQYASLDARLDAIDSRITTVTTTPASDAHAQEILDARRKRSTGTAANSLLTRLDSDYDQLSGELVNIRTGYNGESYSTAGDAVRGQIKKLQNTQPRLIAVYKASDSSNVDGLCIVNKDFTYSVAVTGSHFAHKIVNVDGNISFIECSQSFPVTGIGSQYLLLAAIDINNKVLSYLRATMGITRLTLPPKTAKVMFGFDTNIDWEYSVYSYSEGYDPRVAFLDKLKTRALVSNSNKIKLSFSDIMYQQTYFNPVERPVTGDIEIGSLIIPYSPIIRRIKFTVKESNSANILPMAMLFDKNLTEAVARPSPITQLNSYSSLVVNQEYSISMIPCSYIAINIPNGLDVDIVIEIEPNIVEGIFSCKNLYDKNDQDVIQYGYYDESGTFYQSTTLGMTGYIPVKSYAFYTISHHGVFCVVYNINKEPIKRVTASGSKVGTFYMSNTSVRFARFIFQSSNMDDFCVFESDNRGMPIAASMFNQLNVNPGYYGLKGVAFGTSLTYRSQTTGGYIAPLEMLSGITFDNQGIGSSTIKGNMLNAILNYTDYSDKQVVFLEGFVNDWGLNHDKLGTWKDTTNETVCGCVRLALIDILTKAPYATVIMLIDHYGQTSTAPMALNNSGLTQMEYYDEIVKVAESLSVPVIRLDKVSGFNNFTTDYLLDNIHPKPYGAIQVANVIWENMKSIPPKWRVQQIDEIN